MKKYEAKNLIDKFVDDSKGEMIQGIIDLVSFPSINGDKEENRLCLRHFLKLAREMGFLTMTTSTYDVGIVEMGRGDENLGILVHLDVVDIGDPDKWTKGPFQGHVKDSFVWGRGTVDDKGPALMSLYAMLAVKSLGLDFKRRVRLVIGTDEEGSWADMDSYDREYSAPDFGFSPDGDFPICNAEKGYADVRLVFSDDLNKVKKLKSGSSKNTIPSKAEVEFMDGRQFVSHGLAAHSSVPEEGDNAIIKLCKEIADSYDETENSEILPDFVSFIRNYFDGETYGRSLRIDEGSEYYKGEFVGPTTAAPTVLTLGEEGVVLNVNVRHSFGTSSEDIHRAFYSLTEEFNFEFEITDYMEPIFVDRDQEFLKVMTQVHDDYGVEGGFMSVPGTTYAKAMKNFVSWGPVLKNDPNCAHIEDERLSIDTMLLATKMYAFYIYMMAIKDG